LSKNIHSGDWVIVLSDKDEIVVPARIKDQIMDGAEKGVRFIEYKDNVINPAYIMKMYEIKERQVE